MADIVQQPQEPHGSASVLEREDITGDTADEPALETNPKPFIKWSRL